MNALASMIDFRPAYWQIDAMQRKFVDGYVSDIETIASKTGKRLLAVLQEPFPWELDQRSKAMLAIPLVRAAIAERVNSLSQVYEISVHRTLKEIVSIAYSNISNYIEVDAFGVPEIDLSRATPEMMSAVKSFEIEDKPRGGRKYKFQLHDKIAALRMIAQYQGLIGEDSSAHWKDAEQSVKPQRAKQLPASSSEEDAAELYSKMING